jgi:nitrogen fixation protein NifB
VDVSVEYKLSPAEVMCSHPCFNEDAHGRVGRVHLPVAPHCNIRCRFCERVVCVHLAAQHPGWARELLSPQEALERVAHLVRAKPGERFVVGVAGPGEPLANEETFEALALVHQAFPYLAKCLSTNGLRLQEALPRLLEAGVTSLTVTVNAPDAEVGEQIYAWVRCDGQTYRGREAAALLLERQRSGIRAALDAGLAVKVNTVLIPGVNEAHVGRLARQLSELGVHLMNLMPLIPGGLMAERRAPTCEELRQARDECARWLPQFRLCEHCSADVIRFPGEDTITNFQENESRS